MTPEFIALVNQADAKMDIVQGYVNWHIDNNISTKILLSNGVELYCHGGEWPKLITDTIYIRLNLTAYPPAFYYFSSVNILPGLPWLQWDTNLDSLDIIRDSLLCIVADEFMVIRHIPESGTSFRNFPVTYRT